MTEVEPADPGEGLVRPVAIRVGVGEPDAVRQQHCVPGDALGGVEVLGQQGGGHHQDLSRVHEPLTAGTVGREFPGRV
ncbi:MAG: hypothetical protein ACKPGI_11585 [Verrucomicrobiota bacterium]